MEMKKPSAPHWFANSADSSGHEGHTVVFSPASAQRPRGANGANICDKQSWFYVTAALYLLTVCVEKGPAMQVPDVHLSARSGLQNVPMSLFDTYLNRRRWNWEICSENHKHFSRLMEWV